MKKGIKSGVFFRAGVLVALMAVVVWVVMLSPSSAQKTSLKDLGLEDFIASEITYDGVMHELYWHYEFANQMIRVGRIIDAKAHLRVMQFYINLLPYLRGIQDKKFFRSPRDRAKFDSYAQNLLSILDKIYRELGHEDTTALGKRLQKNVSAMCQHCHKDLRTPIRKITPYGQKIVLGHGTQRVK